jgi:peptidoglycan hydrolase-like protein with peptidoglycan-binding domain
MHGSDVRVLQDFLTRVGVKTTIDGQYGPRTASRVRAWQRKFSLAVTGRVSRQDAATLRGQVNAGSTALQGTGGATMVDDTPVDTMAPVGGQATLGPDGQAVAPVGAPPEVVSAIAAANAIDTMPYRYGGGHAQFEDSAYDCSGSVSYALHGGGLLDKPMDSSDLESFGDSGPGTWITVYANSGHAYVVIAGLRFDTGYHDGDSGPRWSTATRSASGYTVRHPDGL